MDPLSLTASVLAVITAATQVSKGLQALYSLRHARQEIFELSNEVLNSTSGSESTDQRLTISLALRNAGSAFFSSESR